MQIAVAAIVHDNANVRTFLSFLKMLPSIVRTALGGDMVESGSMTALLTIGYQHPFVMFLYMLYAVGVPTGLLTGEVQRGTMELILSRPITKTQVYICAAVLTLVGMFALVVVMFLGTVAAVNIYTFSEPIASGFVPSHRGQRRAAGRHIRGLCPALRRVVRAAVLGRRRFRRAF